LEDLITEDALALLLFLRIQSATRVI